jgi:hypothetical protein
VSRPVYVRCPRQLDGTASRSGGAQRRPISDRAGRGQPSRDSDVLPLPASGCGGNGSGSGNGNTVVTPAHGCCGAAWWWPISTWHSIVSLPVTLPPAVWVALMIANIGLMITTRGVARRRIRRASERTAHPDRFADSNRKKIPTTPPRRDGPMVHGHHHDQTRCPLPNRRRKTPQLSHR